MQDPTNTNSRPTPHAVAGHSFSARNIRLDAADEILEARIHRSLIDTGRPQFHALRVRVKDGAVNLSGPVSSYYAREMAHQAVLSVDGVVNFHSEIKIE